MKMTAMLVSLALLGALVGCSPRPTPTGDAAILQGKWQGQESGGRTGTFFLAVSGNSMEFRSAVPGEWYTIAMTLQEDKQPKEFVGTITACVDPKAVGKEIHAIYRLEKDLLVLKGNGPGVPKAPASFDAPEGRCFEFKKK